MEDALIDFYRIDVCQWKGHLNSKYVYIHKNILNSKIKKEYINSLTSHSKLYKEVHGREEEDID